jgi:hypothetical protein
MIKNYYNIIIAAEYSVYTYLKTLIALQSISKSDALESLKIASKNKNSQYQVILLCRMLFISKGKEFRSPMLGKPELVGKSDLSKWSFLPIELIDGIPFLIVKAYALKGRAENAEDYLKYCLSNCIWNRKKYELPNKTTIRKALEKLINSKKWHKKLNTVDIDWFKTQIHY